MAKRSKNKQRISLEDEAPTNNPFAALASLKDELPEGPSKETLTTKSKGLVPKRVGKTSLSCERKGRAGKTVTILRGVLFEGALLEMFVKELKRALGTNAWIEGDEIIMAGDQTERARQWLARATH